MDKRAVIYTEACADTACYKPCIDVALELAGSRNISRAAFELLAVNWPAAAE